VFTYVARVNGRLAIVNLREFTTRPRDFRLANEALGLDEPPPGYTWHHHQNGHTLMLVPTDLHKAVSHGGGFARSRLEGMHDAED
jgi:HNH/ENDO VII superfamily nuclease